MKFMSTVQRTYLVHKQACAAYLPFADEPCGAWAIYIDFFLLMSLGW